MSVQNEQPPNVTPQILSGIVWHPQQRLVEIKTRPSLAIYDQSCVIAFDVLEVLFATLLQMQLHARGITTQFQPMTPPPKTKA